MIGIVINGDTRPGVEGDETYIGQMGSGSLQGARSYDFLIEGVRNWRKYFKGHEHEIILVIDEHQPVPNEIIDQITADHILVTKFAKDIPRFNDHLYLDSLKRVMDDERYTHIVHADFDVSAFRDPDSTIISRCLKWLNSKEYKFICQPSPLTYREHKMDHASTRFFICKRESLDLEELRRLLDDGYKAKKYPGVHLPCLEHIIGAEAGKRNVLYPPLDMRDHVIFSWVRYRKGLLKELNSKPYEEVVEYINKAGLHGASDLAAI